MKYLVIIAMQATLFSCANIYEQLKTKPRTANIDFNTTSVVNPSYKYMDMDKVLVHFTGGKLDKRQIIENVTSSRLKELGIHTVASINIELDIPDFKTLYKIAEANNYNSLLRVHLNKVDKIGSGRHQALYFAYTAELFSIPSNKVAWEFQASAALKGYEIKDIDKEISREIVDWIVKDEVLLDSFSNKKPTNSYKLKNSI